MAPKVKNCNGCKYMIKKGDDIQKCSKRLKRITEGGSTKFIRCEGEGKGCEIYDCPSYCQYPYPQDVYKGEAANNNFYDKKGNVLKQELLKNKTLMSSYVDLASDKDNVKDKYLTKYKKESEVSKLDSLTCGKLVTPTSSNKSLKFPEIPSNKQLRESIFNDRKGIRIYQSAIDWKKIKITPALNKLVKDKSEWKYIENNTILQINKEKIPIADNGIQLEWWSKKSKNYTEEELLLLLPGEIRPYIDLKFIHDVTGAYLEKYFMNHTVENMALEEVYDWLRMRNLGVKGDTQKISKSDPLYHFYDVERTSSETRLRFELCMNRLMQTEHDDEIHIQKIKKMKNFADLGAPENRLELDYVKAKIVKFLVLDSKQFNNCINLLYLTDKICERGVSTNIVKLMGNFLNMDTTDIESSEYKNNMKVVSEHLLRYAPEILKKIIEISENYENIKCNKKINDNTVILKEIYKNLFNKPMVMNVPTLGIEKFFGSFNKNIITKIILLAFITYIFAKIIGLFNVRYNVSDK